LNAIAGLKGPKGPWRALRPLKAYTSLDCFPKIFTTKCGRKSSERTELAQLEFTALQNMYILGGLKMIDVLH
jgi:hypothetical protein